MNKDENKSDIKDDLKGEFDSEFDKYADELFELLNRISDEEWIKLIENYIKNHNK